MLILNRSQMQARKPELSNKKTRGKQNQQPKVYSAKIGYFFIVKTT